MAEKLSNRMDRLEESMVHLVAVIDTIADRQAKGGRGSRYLAEAQIKNEQLFKESAEHFRQTDEDFRETDERFRQTGERIDKLVSAIGEMLRRQNGGKHSPGTSG